LTHGDSVVPACVRRITLAGALTMVPPRDVAATSEAR
jgi:hypothetical protein